MRDRRAVTLTKMFASVRGIQRYQPRQNQSTRRCREDAELTKSRGNEKSEMQFMSLDSSRRAESIDTHIDVF